MGVLVGGAWLDSCDAGEGPQRESCTACAAASRAGLLATLLAKTVAHLIALVPPLQHERVPPQCSHREWRERAGARAGRAAASRHASKPRGAWMVKATSPPPKL